MATKRMISPNELMSEIDKVYYEHYAMAYDQAIHDFYNAVFRRIRRCTSVDAVEVVRCKECIHQHTLDCPMNYEVETYDEDDGYDSYMACNATNPEGFCMCGERETNEEYVG